MKRGVSTAIGLVMLPCLVMAIFFARGGGANGSVLIQRNQFGVHSVVAQLSSTGALSDPWFVEFCVKVGLRLRGATLIPGWYHFGPDDTQFAVIKALVCGLHEPLVKVTFPEGFTMLQIASRLKNKAQIDSAHFVAWASSQAVRRRYNVQAPTMDGFLMPATYFIIRAEAADVVGTMMANEFDRMWKQISTNFNGSRDSVITLASIVQKEAVRDDELATIAGVYTNRLAASMRLEADPTLQYGRDITITRQDLRDASNAYNTYQHGGLPPGPICNPGRRAIRASISPEDHDFKFFVARGDGTRAHRFARTYTEHLHNVAQYRAERLRN